MVKLVLGSKIKKITFNESKILDMFVKVYMQKNFKGETFTLKNVIAKRPLSGIPANKLRDILEKSRKNFKVDEKIQLKKRKFAYSHPIELTMDI